MQLMNYYLKCVLLNKPDTATNKTIANYTVASTDRISILVCLGTYVITHRPSYQQYSALDVTQRCHTNTVRLDRTVELSENCLRAANPYKALNFNV